MGDESDHCNDWSNEGEDMPWTEECAECGREFETMDHHRSLCGPCRRKRQAMKAPIITTKLHNVRGRYE